MAKVIDNIGPVFSDEKIELFLEIFFRRLLDHDPLVVRSSVEDIYFLVSKCSLTDGVPSKILKAFSQNFTCQSQDERHRFVYYKILCILVRRYGRELKPLAPDFAHLFLSSVHGERDKKALLQLWSCVPEFFKTFSFGHLEQDIHKVFAAYFPVDYNELKGPNAVKREELADALMDCLTASKSPQFVSLTMNLAFEKLSSLLPVAKVDSLRLLGSSIQVFGFRAIQEHMPTIVKAMWNELICCDNADVRHHIDIVIKKLKIAMKKEPTPGITPTFNDCVWEIVRNHLSVESRFFDIALIFVKAASRSEDNTIYNEVVAVLLNQRPLERRGQLTLLDTLHDIKKTQHDCCGNSDCEELVAGSFGGPLAGICLEYLLSTTVCIDVKEKALVCIYCCIMEMTELQRRQLCRITFDYVIAENTLLREESSKCMKLMQKKYEQEFEINLYSEFVTHPGPPERKSEFMLGVLCELSVTPDYCSEFVHEAKNFVLYDLEGEDKKSWVCKYLRRFADCHITLENEHDDKTKFWIDHLGNHLVKFWFDNICFNSCWCDSATEDYACGILYCVSKMDDRQQIRLVEKYIDKVLLCDESILPSKHFRVIIFEALFGSLKPLNQLTFCPSQIRDILRYCVTCAVESDNKLYRTHAARLMAVIVNKIPYGEFLNDLLEEVVWDMLLKTGIESQKLSMRQNAVAAVGYVVKGLYLADSNELEVWLNRLLTYVSTEGLEKCVSEAMKNILQKEEYFLTRICHCNVSNELEKLFSVLPCLLLFLFISDTSSKPECQSVCLEIVALLYLEKIRSRADSISTKEISFIMAKHVNSQQSEDIVVPWLRLWNELLVRKEHIGAYVSELLQSFLDIAKHYKQMNVRSDALYSIYLFAKNYRCEVMPHAQMMVTGLVYCLSDKKRLVRKQAVQARSAWYTLLHEQTSKEEEE